MNYQSYANYEEEQEELKPARMIYQKVCMGIGILLCLCISIEHILFFVLESFLYPTEFGKTIFRGDPQRICKVFAINQGVYNLFLAIGLLFGLSIHFLELIQPKQSSIHRFYALAVKTFFLLCIIVAGIVGGVTVTFIIFIIQMVPPIFALLFTVLGK